jgi:phospholipid/cholesterol/gamma-HCH transport system substrate-binding protein
MLAAGQSFQVTQSAINLENLLGQFIFNMGKPSSSSHGAGSGQQNSGQGSSAQPADPAALSGASGSK